MLESLFLRDFVIVAHAEIDFSTGFCALSGETGAGKSILLDALGLALGNRSDAAMVRQSARQTEICAAFSPSARVLSWLREHELAIDGPAGEAPELQLRRIVTTDGRSKAFINGSPVTVAQLRTLGEQLIEIHGQHASQSLLNSDGQRRLLDEFANPGALPDQVRQAWTSWRETKRLLETAQSRQQEILDEREQLQWRLDEINTAAPQENEWRSLSAEQTRLANAAGLIQETQAAAGTLTEDENSLRNRLTQIISRLRHQARLDPALENAIGMLNSAEIQISEAASELGGYAQAIDLDPARLNEVENRVSEIFQLARKLRCEPDDLHQVATDLAARLTELDKAQDINALMRQVQELAEQYDLAARSLSEHRKKSARRLAKAVNQQIIGLGMANARFEVPLSASEPGPNGIDRIEFHFSSHSSIPARPLSRVASGGELSRVSLAIAVSAAQANPVDTLIFDEADAGVGGAVADAIGQMMRHLGTNRQVLAVTHLPQVAARGHQHFKISKGSNAGADSLNSQVSLLDDDGRIDEIARMLGGAKITKTTRDHASELIDLGRDALVKPQSKPTARQTKQAKAQPKAPSKTGSTAKAKTKTEAKTKPAVGAARKRKTKVT